MMTKNVKTMFLLLLVAFVYMFVFGCGDTGEITISVEGDVEDWEVKNLDTAIEKVAEPILDFGDSVVEFARDTETDAIEAFFATD